MRNYKTKLLEGAIVFAIALALTMSSSAAVNEVTKPMAQTNAPVWSDNFDTYTLGQFLDGTPDDGGWKGWDNDPAWGAFVVDDQALSAPHSVEVVGDTDLVHEYTGATAGQWTYTAWQYVPEDFMGNSYFLLLSDYTDGAGQNNKWAIQIRFDSENMVAESEFDDVNLPLITGQWVELRAEIDLDADWFEFFYDGDLLIAKNWTAGPNNLGDGFLVIDAVDLYANAASAVYYDDMSLEGEVVPMPELEIQTVSGGIGISAVIANTGDADATDVDWNIKVTGGILGFINKEFPGNIPTLEFGTTETVKTTFILGLGQITVVVTADCAEGVSAEKTVTGRNIIFYTVI